MKRILFSILLVILLAACRAPSIATTESTAMEGTPLPTQTAEFTPIPTLTAKVESAADTPTPASPPPSVLPGGISVIQFSANGTYADITDSILTGSGKTYSINAMKGQIMSVSVLPQLPSGGWGYIPMQIKGADGSILCPQSPNTECMFWRGALPSSQDYLVTLTPTGDVPQFVMRVAINPPGKGTQYFRYDNASTGISLTYPDTFAPAPAVVGNYKSEPELALHYIDTGIYDKTNLSEVYLFVSSTSDSQIVATCTEPNQAAGGPEQIVGKQVINGLTFIHSTADDAGAGNYYQQEIYRMVNQGVCYEVILFIHYTSIGNYPPGLVTEFDSNALMQRLHDVLSTFTIK